MPLDSQVEDIVTRVHATSHMAVMAFAGAGSQALAWLHAVGGSSRTIMSAVDIYHEQSMRQLLGFMPAKFTSRRVARLMAGATYEIAREYRSRSVRPDVPVFGLGSTATIATDRTKRGDHRVACAVRDALGSVTYAVTIEKGARDRDGEEDLVSLVMLGAVAEACGVFGAPPLPLVGEESLVVDYRPSELISEFAAGSRSLAVVRPDGHVVSEDVPGPHTLLSGSFNPVHEGHLGLAEAASRHTGLPVLFELPLMNAAKAPIGLAEARKRALQFSGRYPVALTRAPLFAQKAEMFPGSVFVVGVDTAERVVDPRYYDGDAEKMREALEFIASRGCRFLVAGRQVGDAYRTLAGIDVPECCVDLFEAIPERAFREDISSTEIRDSWATVDV